MISLHYCTSDDGSQEPRGRRRRCLLKDCECWFQPRCPQARFCCPACQQEGERWRRAGIRDRRRRPGRRRESHVAGAGHSLWSSGVESDEERVVVVGGPRGVSWLGGGRSLPGMGRPCDRPGATACSCRGREVRGQRFCSVSCRRALRRVLDREARWRQRRRRRWSQQRTGASAAAVRCSWLLRVKSRQG